MTSLLPGNYRRTLRRCAAVGCYCLMLSGLTLAQTDSADKATAESAEMTAQPPTATENITAPTPEEAEPAIYQSREERDMTLLANSLNRESAVWLEALGVPFLSLYEQDMSGHPVGAVLILNAEEQHSNWPESIGPIRTSLPEFGWSSLSTQLPAPETPPLPKRSLPPLETAPSASENKPAGSDSPTTATVEEPPLAENDAPEEAAIAPPPDTNKNEPETNEEGREGNQPSAEEVSLLRLQATINFLHSKGQYNIVLLGNGVGAARAACYIQQLDNSNIDPQKRLIRALVLVNARNRISGSDLQLQHCLTHPKIPVLDVYTGFSQRDQLEAKQRLKQSRRNNYQVYRQIHLPELAHNSMLGENRLTRRIRGFLDSHARGVKVDNAIIVDR